MLRLDANNVLRCAERRARGPEVACDTPVARPAGRRLVIRCRNCHTDHVFVAVQGRIVHLENASSACRLPESSAVS